LYKLRKIVTYNIFAISLLSISFDWEDMYILEKNINSMKVIDLVIIYRG